MTLPWSSCQTSISKGIHCSRAMISSRCMTYPVAATQGSLAVRSRVMALATTTYHSSRERMPAWWTSTKCPRTSEWRRAA
eukprot:3486701-Amphidinium_carterae.1